MLLVGLFILPSVSTCCCDTTIVLLVGLIILPSVSTCCCCDTTLRKFFFVVVNNFLMWAVIADEVFYGENANITQLNLLNL